MKLGSLLPAFFLTLLFLPLDLLACPACAGGSPGAKLNQPPYTIIILGCFIVLTYIPFYLLFRAAKKFDPKNSNENI
jgi:hypothetical protein